MVYGRMTGWGQDGPIAKTAGHDINYIALSGALYCIGTKESGPVPLLNLVGDFGGGAVYMAMGALAAYINAQKTGQGQGLIRPWSKGPRPTTRAYGALASGAFIEERQSNRLDGGSHHYSTYETADGEHIALVQTSSITS